MELIPYTGKSPREVSMPNEAPLPEGANEAVFITMDKQYLDTMIAEFDVWFAGREEIIHMDDGFTDKQGLGFIALEWEACHIDPLFLKILAEDNRIVDYTIYTREEV
jgi:hypothetical protein